MPDHFDVKFHKSDCYLLLAGSLKMKLNPVGPGKMIKCVYTSVLKDSINAKLNLNPQKNEKEKEVPKTL